MLKQIPIVVRLRPDQIHKSDLLEELKIDRFRLDRELLRQPAKYAFWASLYSEAAAKADFLREKLDHLEARLSVKFKTESRANGKHVKAYDVKYHVQLDPHYRELRKRFRRWQNAERILKYAEKAFSQRKDVLMATNANLRKEKEYS